MTITRRWGARTVVAAAAAAGLLAGTAGEARAGDAGAYAAVATLGALAVADLSFAVYGLKAAGDNNLPRDGVPIAQTIVTVPQTLIVNGFLLGVSMNNDYSSDLATFIGTIPAAGVAALSTHGIWALAEESVAADALAGVSVLVGMNTALSMSTLGRAFGGRLHSRAAGIFELLLAAPGLGVGIYESTVDRPQQAPWIALTAWSGTLFVHGAISAIRAMDKDPDDADVPPPPPPSRPALQRAARSLWPGSFTLAPTVLSDGVARVPGLAAAGTF